jgi:hypothetical protein
LEIRVESRGPHGKTGDKALSVFVEDFLPTLLDELRIPYHHSSVHLAHTPNKMIVSLIYSFALFSAILKKKAPSLGADTRERAQCIAGKSGL